MSEEDANECHEARAWDTGKFRGETITLLKGLDDKTAKIEKHLKKQNGSIDTLEKLTTKHSSNWIWLRTIFMIAISSSGISGIAVLVTKLLKLW